MNTMSKGVKKYLSEYASYLKSQNGHTALHRAAESGHVVVSRQLLAAGADPNATDKV
jgi:ankyrin repeat protein